MLKYVSLLCLGLIAYAGVLVAAQLRLAQGIDRRDRGSAVCASNAACALYLWGGGDRYPRHG